MLQKDGEKISTKTFPRLSEALFSGWLANTATADKIVYESRPPNSHSQLAVKVTLSPFGDHLEFSQFLLPSMYAKQGREPEPGGALSVTPGSVVLLTIYYVCRMEEEQEVP